jgi:type IV pilus assembly protein PilZ
MAPPTDEQDSAKLANLATVEQDLQDLHEPDEPGSDRRTSLRHKIALRVDYKRMNTFFADYAKNISKGGTFIKTSKPLDVGTEFMFVLSIPGQADQLRLKGTVMWTVDESQSNDDRPAGMGIRFNFTDDDERKQLEQFVAKLMADKLGKHVAEKLLGKP